MFFIQVVRGRRGRRVQFSGGGRFEDGLVSVLIHLCNSHRTPKIPIGEFFLVFDSCYYSEVGRARLAAAACRGKGAGPVCVFVSQNATLVV